MLTSPLEEREPCTQTCRDLPFGFEQALLGPFIVDLCSVNTPRKCSFIPSEKLSVCHAINSPGTANIDKLEVGG